jgi:hypothetical protein
MPARSQCREDGARRSTSGRCLRTAPVPVFSTFFTSLRAEPGNDLRPPRTISQMPTTSANVTIESNG